MNKDYRSDNDWQWRLKKTAKQTF